MIWIYVIAVSVAIGIVVGSVAEYMPVPSVWQSVGAALVALVLGAVAAMIVWNLNWSQTGAAGLAAFSVGFDIVRLLMAVGAVCALTGALHVAMGRMGGLAPALMSHRPIVLSCVGGLCGALPVAWIIADPVRAVR